MRYAIFDFDGTLIDSMTMWRNVGNTFLEKNFFNSRSEVMFPNRQ